MNISNSPCQFRNTEYWADDTIGDYPLTEVSTQWW